MACPTKGTAPLQRVIRWLHAIPGWSTIGICGAGSVPSSDHPCGGAIDVGGPKLVLLAVERAAAAAMRSQLVPILYVIGPGPSTLGTIYDSSNPYGAPYSGPNSHQGHVHISASPSCATGEVYGGGTVSQGASGSSNPNATSTHSGPCPPGQIPLPGPPGPTAGHGGGLPQRTTQCVDASIVGPIPGSGVFHDVTSAVGSVGSFLGKLPRYLEVGAGGVLMLAGLAAALFAVSGRSNVVVDLSGKTLRGIGATPGALSDARMERKLGGGGTEAPVDLGERRIEGYSRRRGLGTGEAAA